MEHTEKSLEYLLKKIDRREWIPVYGIYQLIKDSIKKRPNIAEYGSTIFSDEGFKEPFIATFYCLYQGISSSLLVAGIERTVRNL